MPSQQELMGHGLPGPLARALGADGPNTGLTATGTNQGGALALTAAISLFGTVASGAGAVLPASYDKPLYAVLNGGSNALLVYPAGTDVINAGSAGAAISVAAGKSAFFYQYEGGWIANVSA